MALAMLGDKLPAEDAERLGLIWKCVDDATFDAEVQSLARRLVAMPTRALVATRAAIDAADRLEFSAALSQEAAWQTDLGAAHDYLEGVAAFMAKRPAVFSDR
jgi:2-(1,2-epoxy-1,2-dihydrophenyl)acetyl-CoA isomerase